MEHKAAKTCQFLTETGLLTNAELKLLFTPEYFQLAEQKCAAYQNLFHNSLALQNIITSVEESTDGLRKLEATTQVEAMTSITAIGELNKQAKFLRLNDDVINSNFKEVKYFSLLGARIIFMVQNVKIEP